MTRRRTTDSLKGQTLVKGHTLVTEGAPFAIDENQQVVKVRDGTMGRGLCSCGAMSDIVAFRNERKQWHREHKARVRANGQPQA